jgi:hypothetical protein
MGIRDVFGDVYFIMKLKLKNNYLKNMKLTEFLDKVVRIGAVFEFLRDLRTKNFLRQKNKSRCFLLLRHKIKAKFISQKNS